MPYTSILKVTICAAFDCSSHQLDLAQGGGAGGEGVSPPSEFVTMEYDWDGYPSI